jgi:hypothetical protein
MKFHAHERCAPLVALDLRTIALLVDSTVRPTTHQWPAALTNLLATLQLREQARSLQGSHATWLTQHKCDTCHSVISRYTKHLVKQIDDFGKALPNYFSSTQ